METPLSPVTRFGPVRDRRYAATPAQGLEWQGIAGRPRWRVISELRARLAGGAPVDVKVTNLARCNTPLQQNATNAVRSASMKFLLKTLLAFGVGLATAALL